MNDDDESQPSTAQTLANLSSSLSALAGSSRAIPSDQDFHFFSNFDRFRHPLRRIAAASESSLDSIAASPLLSALPFPADHDDAYDRLVDANDAILDRLDNALDSLREEDGFKLVAPKNKKKKKDSESDVKMADKKTAAGPRPKVPFHIRTIPRPQTQYSFNVVNQNQPFVHAWLDSSEDGLRLIHPLEKISVSDFVDNDVASIKPVRPPPLESTPFKLVEEVQDLKELAAKLRGVNEFAVDLEHNQYRSFQGLTCLIQISTRTEDFVIDAFKLRVLIGPHLREVFKDPTKRKVMHGAERDILWLQRDFGVYVCNLFDTGQASRELKLERNSLEYLLHHFCGVTANKEYQNADWRLRPVPKEMLRYAREDTHYLLHIYDLMRIELVSKSKDSENPYASLLEVYKRSYDICMQLYEKELLTEDSYLYLYGLQGAGLNAEQLAVVAGLYEWRDVVARVEDESTGYILPNKALLEIAKTMPDTIGQLQRLVKSRHPYVEQHLGSVVSIIINSKRNAAAFEAAVEHLREGRVGRVSEEILAANDEPEVDKIVIPSTEKESAILLTSHSGGSSAQPGESGNVSVSEKRKDASTGASSRSAQVTGVTVQVQKKPSRAFGALLGNTIPKKKLDSGKQDKLEAKLEQIRSSVHFPLHSFSSPPEQPKAVVETPVAVVEVPKIAKQPDLAPPADSKLDDVIMLEDDSDKGKSRNGDLGAAAEVNGDEDEPMSLSDLSSSFQQCFEAANQKKKAVQADKSPAGLQLKLFNYEAARKQVVFGDNSNGDKSERTARDSKGKKNPERAKTKDDGEEEFSQGRRRKAFPATGNRSATFR